MTGSNEARSHSNGIEASGLVREFKGDIRAVDGIDLEVRPGEIYGFLGPNGAGKSTTVHMLTTLLPPTAGSAKVAGYDVVHEGAQVRDAIGAALQEAALDPNLTARDHMRLQGALHGMSKADRTTRGDELIERVGLADAADRKVGGYSGGMKRRLDRARPQRRRREPDDRRGSETQVRRQLRDDPRQREVRAADGCHLELR